MRVILVNIVFFAGLVSLSAGCYMERASLGLIVPSVIVMGLAVSSYFVPARGPK